MPKSRKNARRQSHMAPRHPLAAPEEEFAEEERPTMRRESVTVAFGVFRVRESWVPAVNVYRSDEHVFVCVDLAGVAPESLEIDMAPGRLRIRGFRRPPQPSSETDEPSVIPPRGASRQPVMRIVEMEIDHGSFSREIALPAHVVVEEVACRQDNGLLWIRLPLEPHRR